MNITLEDPNIQCLCRTLDREKLYATLQAQTDSDIFREYFTGSHSAVIADTPVFIGREHAEKMRSVISAIEKIAQTPEYCRAVAAHAPTIAQFDPGARGVMMGYDFHLGPDGPKLIEINTNAGGALINAYLAQAHRACCGMTANAEPSDLQSMDPANAIFESFIGDWRRQRGDAPLETIAIVDEDPQSQFFYPELLLFKTLFERRGVRAVIAPPETFEHSNGALICDTRSVDLVYNRQTDFAFEKVQSAAIRSAYLANDVVVTPNPRVHALLADKRNLIFLCDEDLLRQWNVDEYSIELLAGAIPRTVVLDPDRADSFWADRKKLFFKPAAGYGSKAAYRGDKITRRVWEEILQNDYVAQEIVPPGERNVRLDDDVKTMKVDVRNYTYDGSILLTAARLYQGQTTNMRTPGGGFSPAFEMRASTSCDCRTAY